MRVLAKADDQASVLAQWQGAHAEIWIFNLTFRRLALLLTKTEADDILYVAGIGCRYVTGPFRWENAQLSIGRTLTRLFDQVAGFELLCDGVIGLLRGLKTDIVNSFGEDFLNDSH